MDEKIYQIVEQIVQLHQKAYEVYLPLVEDVCSREVSEDICMYIPGALNFILKRIGRCGKMNDFSVKSAKSK